MKKVLFSVAAIFALAFAAFAQKGVDPQSKKIHEEGVRGTQITSNNSRSYDFGKGKTKTRELLPNPYKLASRRDILVGNIIDVLKEQKIIIDENASRLKDGFIVTQPFVFAKGAVITQNEISRYAILPESDTAYTRGRYTLTIEVQSIDGVQNNVSATAKIEGRAENGLRSEWTTLQSSGIAEDEFLSKLIEAVTGKSPDEPQVQ
ncbi:MAG: hypothetical protein ACR2N3_15715 [Pyrinomonadaceae bacterium]